MNGEAKSPHILYFANLRCIRRVDKNARHSMTKCLAFGKPCNGIRREKADMAVLFLPAIQMRFGFHGQAFHREGFVRFFAQGKNLIQRLGYGLLVAFGFSCHVNGNDHVMQQVTAIHPLL